MTWLIDAQLPPRLCVWLERKGQKSLHVESLSSGVSMSDSSLWEYARTQSYVIVSKDRDFYDRVLLLGSPPQIVHVAVGNCSNKDLFELLEKSWPEILKALGTKSSLIVVGKTGVQVF